MSDESRTALGSAGSSTRSRWVGVFAGHGALIAAQQGLGALTGIIVVREVAKSDYAHYVLAVGVTSAVALLADAGVVSTLLRLSGAERDRPARMGPVVAYAARFRRQSTVYTCIALVPFLALLLARADTNLPSIVIIIALVVVGCFAGAAGQMNAVLARIDYKFVGAGNVGLISALIRMITTSLAVVLLPSMWAVIALLMINALLLALEVRLYGRLTHKSEAKVDQLDAGAREEFRVNARRTLPNNVFFLVQGQLIVWLLALSGQVTSLAEISALSRFGILFTLTSTIISSFIAPVVARQQGATGLVRVVASALAAYVLSAILLLVSMVAVPQVYLTLLGPGYGGLRAEFVLTSLGALAVGLTGVLSGVTQGRAWLKWSWLYIPMTVAWLLVLSFVLGVGSLRSAALFSAIAPLPGLLSESVMVITGYRRDFMSSLSSRPAADGPLV